MPEIIGFDHLYLAVADLAAAEDFYDRAFIAALGFRKNRFALGGAPHVHYYNRHFGYVLRPATAPPAATGAPGLNHLCLRVESVADVAAVAVRLAELGIATTPARCFPDYAPDYWATYFSDRDGNRLEVTNYRQERRQRHDAWDAAGQG